MKTDIRNRVVLPLVLPLVILLGIVVLVGGIAAILLFNTHQMGLMIALVVAAGIVVAFSLANSVDPQDMTIGRRVTIVAAGVLPLLSGAAISLWAANGGVPAEELAWNTEPIASAPEGAAAGATNSQSFCAFENPAERTAETCTDTGELTFPAQPEAETFAYIFDNFESGVPHNLQLFELASADEGQPGPGAVVFGVDDGAVIITGVDDVAYEVEQAEPTTFEEGAQFYYNCVVHPAMQGVLTIGSPAEAGGGEA